MSTLHVWSILLSNCDVVTLPLPAYDLLSNRSGSMRDTLNRLYPDWVMAEGFSGDDVFVTLSICK